MFEQDYIMRQIKECVAALMKLLFNINTESSAAMLIKSQEKQSQSDELIQKIDKGHIREAMSELNTVTEKKTKDDLLIGYQFYSHLCKKDDDFLELCRMDFPEIREEMKKYFSQYGSSDVIDLFL